MTTTKKRAAKAIKPAAPKKKAAPKTKRTRVAGRAAGTPNKNSKKHSLLEYARANGKTPAEFMIDVMHGKAFKDGSGNLKKPTHEEILQAAKDVAPYCHPKLRSQEIKGEIIPGTFIIKHA